MASRASDPGAVLAIGGAEDKLKDRVILGRFIQLAGGEGARIAVVSTASSLGAVIAGTSAGSSALSTHMVAFGASGATPKHRMVQVASGLGIVTNVIIDQHFEQRNRLGRLLSAIAQSPNLLGVGLDEDTAALFEGDELEALGKGAVTIVDGSDIVTDAFFTKGHRPMMVSGAV